MTYANKYLLLITQQTKDMKHIAKKKFNINSC